MNSILIKGGNWDTEGYTGTPPGDDEGKDWGDACTSQGTTQLLANYQELGEGQDSSSGGTSHAES